MLSSQRARQISEEEEWRQLNERLAVREQERRQREQKQAEEDAQRLQEVAKVRALARGSRAGRF